MKRLVLIGLLMSVTVVGCGKQKTETKKSSSESSAKVVSSDTSEDVVSEGTVSSSESAPNSTTVSTANEEAQSEIIEEEAVQADLDIEAINHGDFHSLVGTWKNGKGDVLTIDLDGSSSVGQIHGVPNSDQTSKIPYANVISGPVGAALSLFKVGFENPDGDQSDTSKPRLIITQMNWNFAADEYYYRQE